MNVEENPTKVLYGCIPEKIKMFYPLQHFILERKNTCRTVPKLAKVPRQGNRKRLRRLPVCQQTVPGEKEASSTKPQQIHNFYANTSQSITRKWPGTRVNMNEFTAIRSQREVGGGDGDSATPPRHFTRSYPLGSVIKSFSLLSQSRSTWALTSQCQLGTVILASRFLTSADTAVFFR